MGYVDFETMLAFKEKLLRRLERIEKAEWPDRRVCCRLGKIESEHPFDDTMFASERAYESGAEYSFAVGNRSAGQNMQSHYFYRGNGNGFKAPQSDYLHQRKRYLDLDLDYASQPAPKMRDLFNLLFGRQLTDEIENTWRVNPESVNYFPGVSRSTSSILLTIPKSYSAFLEALEYVTGADVTMINALICSANGIKSDHRAYRGKIYVVKNKFRRDTGVSQGWFCEEVFGYLHIIVSINPDADTGRTLVYISQLRDFR